MKKGFRAKEFAGRRLKFENGDIYEGEWKNHKSHGEGVYLSKDGSRYEG